MRPMKYVGTFLEEVRIALHMSIRTYCSEVGITLRTYAEIRGGKPMSARVLAKFYRIVDRDMLIDAVLKDAYIELEAYEFAWNNVRVCPPGYETNTIARPGLDYVSPTGAHDDTRI